MRIPKRYGVSHIDRCPFCNKQSTVTTQEGVPVCLDHKDQKIPEMKCVCGEWLIMKKGKFGIFFNCMKCGNKNLSKILEVNPPLIPKKTVQPNKSAKKSTKKRKKRTHSKPHTKNKPFAKSNLKKPTETVVRSDELNFI